MIFHPQFLHRVCKDKLEFHSSPSNFDYSITIKRLFMPDNLKNTGKQDDSRINVNQDHEVTYWTKELGVTAEKLREAVKAVGPMVKDVRKYLDK
jgi:hypothetical protein